MASLNQQDNIDMECFWILTLNFMGQSVKYRTIPEQQSAQAARNARFNSTTQ